MMHYNFSISEEAEKDIALARQWYEEQKEGLGKDFVDAVDNAFASIISNPMAYGIRRKNTRDCIVKRFPYIVLFHLPGNAIHITAVFHTSKKP